MRPIAMIYRSMMCMVFVLVAHTNVRSQDFHWAKQLGSADADEGTAIAVSRNGNIYSGGNFQDTMDIDPGPGVVNLIAQGQSDIFISRMDSAGNFVWTRQIGGAGSEYCNSMAADKKGNVYITGTFLGMTDFDPGPGTFNLTSSASSDAFVMKLDASGNFAWAKQFGPGTSGLPQPVIANGIALDGSGNVYTTGSFDGPSDFDPGSGTFMLFPLQYNGTYTSDIYVSKLDTAGNFVWAKQLGGTNFESAYAIAADSAGNVYTTGFFNGTVDFDPGPGTYNLAAPPFTTGTVDIFISKLDAAGNFSWARNMGGGRGYAIAVDNAGFVYASGDFPNDSTIIYKLDPSGNNIWAKEFGASICWSLVADDHYDLFLTGWFSGTRDLDPGPGLFNLTGIGTATNSYISKLDSAGNLSWAKQLGGTSNVMSRSLAVDGKDNVYTTGLFEGTADFDPEATTYNLATTGSMDAFIHKLKAVGLGVEEADVSAMFNVYPNPSTGKFTVEFGKGTNCSRLVLTDLMGEVVERRSVNNRDQIEIELNQASGIYILEVYDSQGNKAIARIVKQ